MSPSELLTPSQLLTYLAGMPRSSAQPWLLNHFISLKQMRGTSAPPTSQNMSLQLDYYDATQTPTLLMAALAKSKTLPLPWATGQAFKLVAPGTSSTAKALSAVWLPVSHTAPPREPRVRIEFFR